jgi:lipopolysaccharide export system protein LptA
VSYFLKGSIKMMSRPLHIPLQSIYLKTIMLGSLFNLLFIASILTASSAVYAEQADREKPIVAESDKLSLDNAKKISVFEGNVIITQGTMRITAQRVVITEDKDGMRHASGTGNPTTFRQKRDGVDEYVDGHSLRFEYDGKIERIELFEQAELKRGRDDVKGEYIAYDTATEYFKVNGNAAREATGAGRVHAIIQPAQTSSATPATPAPVTHSPAKPAGNPDKR